MTVRVSLNTRRMVSTALLIVGIGCLGVYGWSLSYAKIHQVYESWRFDHAREEKSVQEDIPVIIVAPRRSSRTGVVAAKHENKPKVSEEGSVIGRINIPRLSLSAMVEEGTE